MTELQEGNLTFRFETQLTVVKYDEWPPYREWSKAQAGGTAVDFVAYGPRKLWLIEVKDFRVQTTPPKAVNSSRLSATVAKKVKDTITCLASLARQAEPFAEQAIGRPVRIAVLHLEPPIGAQRLFPTATQTANIQQRLNQKCQRHVTAVVVLSIATTPAAGVPWNVT